MPQFQARYLVYAALLATAAIYWNGLSGPFILDDLHNLAPIQRWLDGQASTAEIIFGNGSGLLGRPVSMASFWATVASGGMHSFPFKFGNLIIHLACGLLAWKFVRTLLARDTRLAAHADLLGALAAALWLLHPINVSTVLYAVQRMAQLSTLFALAALWSYLVGRTHLKDGHTRKAFGYLFLVFPCLLLLGIFSKENAAVVPLLCLLLETGYFQTRLRQPLIKTFFGIFLLAPALLAVSLLVISPELLLGGYTDRSFTLVERVLSQARALLEYLGLIAWPRGSQMGVYVDDFAVSTGLFSPPSTAVSILVLATASVLAFLAKKRAPSIFVGWFFFVVAHLVESSFLPLELYFEHRNYLPALGLSLAFVGGSTYMLQHLGRKHDAASQLAGKTLFLLTAALLSLSTWHQVQTWRSEEAIVRQALKGHPTSLRANLQNATLAFQRGDYRASREITQRLAGDTDPQKRLIGILGSLTVDCLSGHGGNPEYLHQVARLRRDHVELPDLQAFTTLSKAVREKRCSPDITPALVADTLVAVLKGTRNQPDASKPKWMMRAAAANLYIQADRWQDAQTQAELAWQPGVDAAIGGMLTRVYIHNGLKSKALKTLQEVDALVANHELSGTREIDWLQTRIAEMPDTQHVP